MSAAAAKKDQKQEEQPAAIKPVLPRFVNNMGHHLIQMEVIVPRDTPEDALDKRELWQHAAQKLVPGAFIRVVWEDYSKGAELFCHHVQGTLVRMIVLNTWKFEELLGKEINFGPDYYVESRGPLKYCIVDKKSGEVVQDMIPTQADAVAAMEALVVNPK